MPRRFLFFKPLIHLLERYRLQTIVVSVGVGAPEIIPFRVPLGFRPAGKRPTASGRGEFAVLGAIRVARVEITEIKRVV